MTARTSARPETPRPAQAAPAPAAPRRRRSRAAGTWYFLLPALALYAFAVLIPSARGIGFAFTDWNGLDLSWNFVGLDNFTRVLDDDQAIRAVRNTLALAVVITVVENLIGLLLALGVHSKIKSRNVLRLIFFAPVVVVSVVIAFLWQFIYTPGGPLTQLFEGIGLGALAQNWLGDPSIALWAIAFVVIWQFAGYSMVIFLAGLQGVPKELLEAGAIDGAGPVRRFWSIVRPLLGPAITVNVMLSMIRGLMIFDQIWVMTQGGPAQSTDSLSTLVYRNAFQYGEFGYSTALAVVLALFVAVISIVQYRMLSRREKK
ncbi:carbohydrate ABC transporter permease [Jiangella endophytica]|uniref:carbohydrate ABC transporter permease n=1 Tax=Jiangella endophytica TaxID=1623398 RepID=UPI0018E57A33|nr:sugar ABC transporter permease [Jiangella endophytica]